MSFHDPFYQYQHCVYISFFRRGLPIGDVSGPGFCNVKATANPTFHNDNMKGQKHKSRSSANIQVQTKQYAKRYIRYHF